MSLAVILPTYNESGNIENLVNSIFALNLPLDVIVVDDESPDGTAQKVLNMREKNSRIHCVICKDRHGRGISGVAGFKYALNLGAEYIIEMDADFSHDPIYIPDFLKAIKQADIVIGSRFVQGGEDCRQNVFRRMFSLWVNYFLKTFFFPNVLDCTSGYRCFKRQVLKHIGLDKLQSCGPAIIGEVLYLCRKFSIKEIPIRFLERRDGCSKLKFSVLIQCLFSLLRLSLTEKWHNFVDKILRREHQDEVI
ncbi:MAG: polyprenol monophosphomannose synthase [Candidatus Omnitrophota bacterium]|nr:MAG: polyprenol monophosphomannose synthase [Candidatus Omnitrophota bacterium]